MSKTRLALNRTELLRAEINRIRARLDKAGIPEICPETDDNERENNDN
jgi:hypothetical protein